MKEYKVDIMYLYTTIIDAQDENEAQEKAENILENVFDDIRARDFIIEVEETERSQNKSENI